MKTFVTSDLHFHHKNIITFCPKTRPFTDIDHMNSEMIRMWNEIVGPEDLVFILGDDAFCNGNMAAEILNSLSGRKILIQGNHDYSLLKKQEFVDCFESIHDIFDLKYNGVDIVMCHYPIFDHKNAGRGSLMLHGHRHGHPTNIPGRIKDVGFDATGNIVTLLESVIVELLEIEPMHHH